MADVNTKLLDTIDLTGDEPVITTKIIKQVFINLSDDDDDDDATVDGENDENMVPVQKVRVTNKKCEVCLEEVSKYTCPCCKMRTCSLDCVLEHKQKTGCSGQRNKTSFVARTEFNNIHLLNDYRLLEEAARIADNAKRDKKWKRGGFQRRPCQYLQKNVQKSGVTLYCMEEGMKRREENRSRYDYHKREIKWTVKFVFDDIGKEVMEFSSEKEILENILAKYIDKENALPENKIIYASYIQQETVAVFFRNECDFGENWMYNEVNHKKTLKQCLDQKSVLEYPEFHVVVLPESVKRLAVQEFVKEKDTSPALPPLGEWLDS